MTKMCHRWYITVLYSITLCVNKAVRLLDIDSTVIPSQHSGVKQNNHHTDGDKAVHLTAAL